MKTTTIIATLILTGCASGISSMQQQELTGYEAKGLAVQEKSTSTATALGFLPGGGSFYTRNYGFGVLNLLTWPYSILWDPISGYNGAQEINYHATLANVNKLKDNDIAELENLLMTQQLDNNQYLFKKHEIERKYSPTGSTASHLLNYAPMPPNKPVEKPVQSSNSSAPAAPIQTLPPVYQQKAKLPAKPTENDLRDCLQLPSNEAVIQCTEKGR